MNVDLFPCHGSRCLDLCHSTEPFVFRDVIGVFKFFVYCGFTCYLARKDAVILGLRVILINSFKMCGGFRTDLHLRFFYSNSDQFCSRIRLMAFISSFSTPPNPQVVSPPTSPVSKYFGNCNMQDRNLRPIAGSRKGEGDAPAFPVAGVPFPSAINPEHDKIFSFSLNNFPIISNVRKSANDVLF